ncbi:MAG: prolyl oligopeptidase family serine peptidase [Bacteroidetes bacterium]|nr:prolyl oligopeptidase family serine peptidase [Bacteroidota bacterium]
MKSKLIIFAALLGAALFAFKPIPDAKLKYPTTKKVDTVDTYFGTKVPDPYRWLENDLSDDVKAWVKAENEVTNAYLSQIPYRDKIRKRLEEVWNYPRFTAPYRKGKNYFYFKNNGLQNQSVMYMEEGGVNDKGKVLLDPNKLSTDGTVSLGGQSFSKDGRYMAYSINRSGSDWQEIYVLEVATGRRTKDSLRWVKFSGMAWKGNGFYYSRYEEPTGSDLSSQNKNQKIYYHELGKTQLMDALVFEDKDHPSISYGAGTTDDERFLLLYGNEGAASGNSLYFLDLDNQDKSTKAKKIFEGYANNYSIVDNVGDKFLLQTDKNAPKYQLVMIDPNHPEEANWKTIIPENKKNVLEGVGMAGGKLFATYMQDASKHEYQYDMNGKLEREIALPSLGSVGGFAGEKDDKDLYYTFTSFTYPTTVFRYNVATGVSTSVFKPEVKFNPDDYVTKQVFYTSKDGTKVPMFIVHKKGLKLDGNNPTYLYAYGGFNISLNPSFSVTRLVLLENGGVFAMPNLRGGGEYGEDWHKGGMIFNKQNVFNDFIAAGEYLIKEKYTSTKKLAVAGGSNGGLLIGACMNQRPDLYRVCFPAVGVMDMLRYHKFTIGYAWTSEYGSSDNEAQFKYIYKYSPVHNVKAVNYPATMVTTADHDDRVVPAHSFKFIANLQEKQKGDNPVLIRIDSKAGHGAGKPTAKQIDEWADIWSFMFYNMGITPKY